jgi:hypothetical protein
MKKDVIKKLIKQIYNLKIKIKSLNNQIKLLKQEAKNMLLYP